MLFKTQVDVQDYIIMTEYKLRYNASEISVWLGGTAKALSFLNADYYKL